MLGLKEILSMVSSSSSHQPNEESSRFSENEASREIRIVEKSPKMYDVFINRRRPDVKNTLARELYKSLPMLGFKEILSIASSALPQQPNEDPSRFSENDASREIRAVEKSPKVYDVFINHRGPDVKDTLARELYKSLQALDVRTFLDSEEREIGCSFTYTIETAIRSASVHVAIFSPRYAESAWCLNELLLMLDTDAIIIPVFYGAVEPSDVRYVEKGRYKNAFKRHIEKEKEDKRYGEKKLKAWKEALHKVSLTAGFESSKHDNNDDLCKSIASKVIEEAKRKEPIYVAENPVGLDELVKDFEIFYQDRKKKGQANIHAISGIGGIGKSTLARELFNRKRSEYDGACFLSNVRENFEKGDLPSLQCKLLKDLLRENHKKFECREDGISQIRKSWDKLKDKNLRFLIVLDDVNNLDQLEAFPILEKLGHSLAIVTTREKGVLTSARISEPYNLVAMSPEYRRQLFCWHAFRQYPPAAEYEKVVEAFTDACRGLPLYLRVLGKHIVNKNVEDCRSALNKYKSMLHEDITKSLKISVDTLDKEVKMLFMDLACFFVNKSKNTAVNVLERCGWNASHALNTLKDKGLVEEIKGRLDQDAVLTMHDLLRDLGREMAEEEHPSRPWRQEHLTELGKMGFREILGISKLRCFQSIRDTSMDAQITYFLADSDSFFERSTSLLWLELDLEGGTHESIPPWIPLQNLRYLKIKRGILERLWQSDQVPSSLKELCISQTTSVEGLDLLAGPNHLERISVSVENMTMEGWSFLESIINPIRLVLGPSNVKVQTVFQRTGDPVPSQSISISLSLSNVILKGVLNLNNRGQPRTVRCPMGTLQELEIFNHHLVTKIMVSGFHYPNFKSLVLRSMEGLIELELKMVRTLNSLDLTHCKALKIVSGISDLRNFVTLNINRCSELEELPCLADLTVLQTVRIVRCDKLNSLELLRCENLNSLILNFLKNLVSVDLKRVTKLKILELYDCQTCKTVSGISDLPYLETLIIYECRELEELPRLGDLPMLQTITIARCDKLHRLELHRCEKLKSVVLSFMKNLVTLDLKSVSGLNSLQVNDCQNCKTVSGISDLANLVTLSIKQCPELEELPRLGDLAMLQTITIVRCDKLNRLELHTCGKLKSVILSSMENLHTVDLKMLTELNSLQLNDCQNCKTVSGISDLANLVTLSIIQCPELEQLPCLADMTVLQTVTIASCEKLNRLKLHRCKKLKSVVLSFMKNLVTLDLKSVSGLNSLQLNDCQNCITVSGISDLANLETLSIKQCPELEELPCLDHLSCLRTVTFGRWEKLNGLDSVSVDNMTPKSPVLGPSRLSVELASYRSGEVATVKCSPSIEYYLSNIRLKGILDLNNRGQALTIGCPMGRLQKLDVFEEHHVPKVLVSGYDNLQIKSIVLTSMEGPIKLELKMVTSLHILELTNCKTLKVVSGISGLPNLVTLKINRCSELEELPCLSDLNCLQTVTIGKCQKLNSLEIAGCKSLKTVEMRWTPNVEVFSIRRCPNLDNSTLHLVGLSCLQRIIIDECGKLKCLRLSSLNALKSLKGTIDLTEVDITDCPKLEELPNHPCFEKHTIQMQHIAAIEESPALRTL